MKRPEALYLAARTVDEVRPEVSPGRDQILRPVLSGERAARVRYVRLLVSQLVFNYFCWQGLI
ncbi:MAG: hypothetical protein M2R45_00905 [Verrucomicrobia subdivision 3 bacterium]|nr:hypothetical protein [Limisphaerales bacterium]MCS1414574.1 hypothetical protein [Limisphaerales bacterium]